MKVLGLTLLGVGYVLGSKAGRERYEQIRALARAATERWEDPRTQSRLSEYTDRLATYARPADSPPRVSAKSSSGSRANARDV